METKKGRILLSTWFIEPLLSVWCDVHDKGQSREAQLGQFNNSKNAAVVYNIKMTSSQKRIDQPSPGWTIFPFYYLLPLRRRRFVAYTVPSWFISPNVGNCFVRQNTFRHCHWIMGNFSYKNLDHTQVITRCVTLYFSETARPNTCQVFNCFLFRRTREKTWRFQPKPILCCKFFIFIFAK